MTPTEGSSTTGVPDPIGPPDLASTTPERDEKDVVRRFAERGEEALHRLVELPGGAQAVKAVAELGRHVDELGRKARGVDALEERIAQLEREVAELRRERPTA